MIPPKTWKYVSIGLIAILAVGFTFPQAFAHMTSNLSHNIGHIVDLLNAIQGDTSAIKAKTNNLPNSPASSGDISGAQTAIESSISAAEANINSNTNAAVTGLATETTVATRASQESVDNLQTSIDAIQSDVQNVLSRVESDQMLLTWQFSGTFSASTRAVIKNEDAYSGVATVYVRTTPDADGDGDSHDCELSDTGITADKDNNGISDTDVHVVDGVTFGSSGGNFIAAGTDQLFMNAFSVPTHADCAVEINLLVEEKK